jgi:hypothetical protein
VRRHTRDSEICREVYESYPAVVDVVERTGGSARALGITFSLCGRPRRTIRDDHVDPGVGVAVFSDASGNGAGRCCCPMSGAAESEIRGTTGVLDLSVVAADDAAVVGGSQSR